MNGRKSFRRSPEEMRFKKDFFPTNLWRGDLTNFSPKTTPLKSGDEKTKS